VEHTKDAQADPLLPLSTCPPASLRLWKVGWEQAGRRTGGDLERALVTFELAYAEDPTSLAIPLTILFCRVAQATRGYLTSAAAAKEADKVIARVLAHRPSYPPVIAYQAWFRAVIDRELSASLSDLDWAVQTMPEDHAARLRRAWVLSGMGRLSEAVCDVEQVVRATPHERGRVAFYAWMLLCSRRFEDALGFAQSALQNRPDNDVIYAVMSSIYAIRGDVNESIEAAERAMDFSSGEAMNQAALGYAYAVARQANRARALIHKLESRNEPSAPATMRAAVWLALGDQGKARVALHDADILKEPTFFFAQHDPRLSALGWPPPIRDASPQASNAPRQPLTVWLPRLVKHRRFGQIPVKIHLGRAAKRQTARRTGIGPGM
jgi:tetratricopeptide (TPR) repeat protein